MPIAIDGSNEVATVAKVTITTEKLGMAQPNFTAQARQLTTFFCRRAISTSPASKPAAATSRAFFDLQIEGEITKRSGPIGKKGRRFSSISTPVTFP